MTSGGARSTRNWRRRNSPSWRAACRPICKARSCSSRICMPAPIPAFRVRVRLVTPAHGRPCLPATCSSVRPKKNSKGSNRTTSSCMRRISMPIRRWTACASGTAIALSFAQRCIVIAGTEYAGEIKKSIFTVMNWILPRAGRAADALQRQYRRGRRRRIVLRPVGHRQDDAVLRSAPQADRRRRARLGRGRRIQFRRRLLRQGDRPVEASTSRRSGQRHTVSARCWRTWSATTTASWT